MNSVGQFRGQGLTLKEKLHDQISVDFRGHIFLIKDVNQKEIQLSIDEKRPQNVQNHLLTIEETPVAAILLFKIRPKILLD